MQKKYYQSRCGLFTFCAVVACGACSSSSPEPQNGDAGGSASNDETGGTNTSGGATDRGGATSTGGTTRFVDSTATGGALNVGGSTATGGASGGSRAGSASIGGGGASSSSGGSGGNNNAGSTSTGGHSGATSVLGGNGGSNNAGSTNASGGGGHSGGASGSLGGNGGNNNAGSTSTGGVGHSGGASSSLGGNGGNSNAGSTSTGAAGAAGFDPCPATGDCKILPLGDSITEGDGADPGDHGGYRVELFKNALTDSKHITFVGSKSSGPATVSGQPFPPSHEGHAGWVITQINGIATTAQTVTVTGTSYPGALRDMPNIVLLFIGTNDEGYASSEAGASDRLATLIDKIVAALPNALLVVSSIYPFAGCKDTNYTPTQCAANVATYDAAIPGVVQQRVAQGKHVLFVDMSSPPTGALSTDNVHPNDTVGYPWMGDNWYTVIKGYLH